MKSKRSKAWTHRMHTTLLHHMAALDVNFAFECAVMGEAGMRARYTHRQLKQMLVDKQRAALIASTPRAHPFGQGGGGAGGQGVFTIPAGVSSVHVALVGGGSAGGGDASGYGAGGGGYSQAAHPYLSEPKS